MRNNTSSTLIKTAAAAAVSSLLALGLTACHKEPTYVKCYGVSAQGNNNWIGMTAGECEKLANSKSESLAPADMQKVTKYTAADYIKCYGVAAGSMNDCGTKVSACGGTIKTPKEKTAWISLPEGLCKQIKGGIVELPAKS